ncbi:MAG: hypothetical protein US76_03610 [Parcubacteria group bacterium GW2011_GWA2_38_13b]|nr:MAG: hypothetical protein US76_03610 [Parcubacteria group bacterium GW2011_GWA2_38_13b]
MEKKFVSCREACPTHTDVSEYIRLLLNGKFYEAWKINRQANVFPSICARVCTHPCELFCKRTCINYKDGDPVSLDSVSIKELKRSVVDNLPENYQERFLLEIIPTIKNNDKKIVIIGSGLAGLTIANDLRLAGCDVTIFEANRKAGGMIRYGIPQFRLPREVVDKEVYLLEKLGVKFIYNTKIGENIMLENLRKEYDACVVAIGADSSIRLNILGEDNKGVCNALDFLQKQNLDLVGKRVIVIGGGATAIDCARTAIRLVGTKGNVFVVFPESLEEISAKDELKEMVSEGIRLLPRSFPERIIEGRNKEIISVALRGVKSLFDKQGRFDLVFEENPNFSFFVGADNVIVAIGQKTYFDDFKPFLMSGSQNIFLAGDCAAGKTLNVIEVIAGGHIIAEKIKKQLGILIEKESIDNNIKTIEFSLNQLKIDTATIGRNAPRLGEINFSERSTGFNSEDMIKEGMRCFQCGISIQCGTECIACRHCIDVCPQDAISLIKTKEATAENNDFFINGEYFKENGYEIVIDCKKCINCAICVIQCPCECLRGIIES